MSLWLRLCPPSPQVMLEARLNGCIQMLSGWQQTLFTQASHRSHIHGSRQVAHADAVSGLLLQCGSPSLRLFVLILQVDDSSFAPQLLKVIQKDPDVVAGKGKVLVFARDTAAADDVSALLDKHGIR